MSRFKNPAPEWFHRLFVSYVTAMIVVFLLPMPTAPLAEPKHVDKLLHFGIFTGFALLFWMDQQRSAWWTFSVSAAFAAGIELVQWVLPYRDGDWMDFAAGAAGAGLAIIVVLWVRRGSRLAGR